MFERLKRAWHALRSSPPGRRFQESYERRHATARTPLGRVIGLSAGVVVVAAGIFFLPAPGPGTIVVAIGAALIARESRPAARALDALELRLRRLARWALDFWARSGALARGLLLLLGLAAAAGLGYGLVESALFLTRSR